MNYEDVITGLLASPCLEVDKLNYSYGWNEYMLSLQWQVRTALK